MVGNSLVSSTCPSVMSSYSVLPVLRNGVVKYLPNLNLRPGRRIVSIKATSDDGESTQQQSELKNPLAVVFDIPKTIWRQTLRPLSDFGFGRRSIWEGGVGLFIVSSVVLFVLSLAWLRGFQLRSKFRKYLAVFEFAQACGICNGTPVRIRGVTVGNVIRVNPSLKSIEAVVEVSYMCSLLKFLIQKICLICPFAYFAYYCLPVYVFQVEDDKVIIPRNSLVEVNQSGLLMETMIDITPRNPIPTPAVGPLDPDCVKEGLIICDRQKIKGIQGVSLDALVGIFTRLGREVEEIGVANTYSLAVRAAAVIEEAKPLLTQVIYTHFKFSYLSVQL